MPDSLFNPYPGLRPFASDEDYLFFGREEQTAELLRRLGRNRFVAVVGTSGSGKSSLVRCGLLSELQGGGMVEAGSHWEIAVMKPGGDPIRRLAESLVDAELYDPDDPEALDRIAATLRRSDAGLVEAARQSDLDEGANLVLVVDQFEEIFRFHRAGPAGAEDAPDFVRLLLEASRSEAVPIYIILTMRSDFLGDCSRFAGLAEAVNDGEYLIPRLNRDQTRAAIEGPAKVAGGAISWRLMVRLLNDVEDEADRLPVLQHALMRLWEAWAADHQDDEPLDLRHYEAIGGLAEALSLHADEVFAALPDDRARVLCAKLFKALTEKGVDNRGVRRPARVDRLIAIVGTEEEEAATVIDAFRRPGVTFLMPSEEVALEAGTVVDISHESLMRGWRRLSSWVEEEAQSVRIYQRLLETAQLWRDGKAGLYHDPDLQIARTWFEDEQPSSEWASQYGGGFELAARFLEASHEAVAQRAREKEAARQREVEQANALAEAERKRAEVQRRGAGRLRRLLVGAALIAVIAVVASVIAVRQTRKAEGSEKVAAALASKFKERMVKGDFDLAVAKQQSGDETASLAYIARALRNDPNYSAAGMRALNMLASGRFPVERFPAIRHRKPISGFLHNKKHDLLLTLSEDGREVHLWDLMTGSERELEVGREAEGLGPVPEPLPQAALERLVAQARAAPSIWLAGDPMEPPSVPRYFRKNIELPSGRVPVRADLLIMVDDEFELSVNGIGIGGGIGWNKSYLVSLGPSALRDGLEVVIEARNYGQGASVVAAVSVSFEGDGEPLVITTDASWQSSEQPDAGFVDSEEFDPRSNMGANLEMLSEEQIRNPQWSADGDRLLAHSVREGGIAAWDLASGKRREGPPRDKLQQASLHGDYKVSPFDGPGDLVGQIDPVDGTLGVWNLTTGEAVATSLRTEGSVIPGQWRFSPDGRRLIGLFSDAVIVAWDVLSGEEVGRVSTRPVRATELRVSNDGRYVLARDEERKMVNWWELGESGFTGTGDWIELPFLFQRDGDDEGTEPDKTWWWRILASGDVITFIGEGEEETFGLRSYRLDGDRRQVAEIQTEPVPREENVRRRLQDLQGSWDQSSRIFGTVQGVRIDLWDMRTGEPFPESLFAPEELANAALSPDGRRVIATSRTKGFSGEAGSAPKKIFVFDLFKGRLAFPEPITLRSPKTSAFFSPDGETLLTTDPDVNLVRFWDLRSGREIRTPVVANLVEDAVFASSGGRVAFYQKGDLYFGSEGDLTFVDQTLGEFLICQSALAPAIPEYLVEEKERGYWTDVAAPPEGSKWLTLSRSPGGSATLEAWDAAGGEGLNSVEYEMGEPRSWTGTAWSADRRRMVFSNQWQRARVIDVDSGATIHEFDLGVAVGRVAISADGMTAACAGGGGRVAVWSEANGEATFRPFGHQNSDVDALCLSASGSVLAMSSRNNQSRSFVVMESSTGRIRLGPREVRNAVSDLLFTKDERAVIVSAAEAIIPMIDLESGETLREFNVREWSRKLDLSADGRLLAVGSGGTWDATYGEAYLFDVASGRMVAPPLPHGGCVLSARFSPDATMVATSVIEPGGLATTSSSAELGTGYFQLWDVATGNPLIDPIGGQGSPVSAAFQTGGDAVAVGWTNGVCQTYPIPARSPAPDWIGGLIEAMAGRRLGEESDIPEEVSDERLATIRRQVLADAPDLADDADWFRWVRWLFEDPETRAVSPGAKTSMKQHLARLRASGSIEDLHHAVRLDPNHGPTFAQLALRYQASMPGDLRPVMRPHWEETVKWFSDRSIALAPEDPDVWAMRAEVMGKVGRRMLADEAAAKARVLLPPDGRSPNVHYQGALALEAAGRTDEAQASLARALEQLDSQWEPMNPGEASWHLPDRLKELRSHPESDRSGATRWLADIAQVDPIPGTYEDFDEVVTGSLPEGWRVWNRSDPGSRPGVSHVRNWQTDLWNDWAVVQRQQLEWGTGPTRARILEPGPEASPVVNGKRGPLLEGSFALAASENRRGFQIQYLETPDFDCSGREGVHLAFNSAYESMSKRMATVEYSLDQGKSWLPVVYFVHAYIPDLRGMVLGQFDLEALLAGRRSNLPWWLDVEDGRVRGSCFGDFVVPADTPGLKGRFEFRKLNEVYKQREMVPLPEADGASTVRIRFGSIASSSLYWAIDKVGLYERPAATARNGAPEVAQGKRSFGGADAARLATLALGESLGIEAGSAGLTSASAIDHLVEMVDRLLTGSPAPGESGELPGSRAAALEASLLTEWARRLDHGNREVRIVGAMAQLSTLLGAKGVRTLDDLQGEEGVLRRAHAILTDSGAESDDFEDRNFRNLYSLIVVLRGLVAGWEERDVESSRVLISLAGVLSETDLAILEVVKKAQVILSGEDLEGEGSERVLLERGSVWKYFYEGTLPDPDWHMPDYDDEQWFEGPARLGYSNFKDEGNQNDGEVTRFFRIGDAGNNKFVTAYFRSSFEVEDPSQVGQLLFGLQRDDGAIIYVNGQELVRDNLPEGLVSNETFAISTVSGPDEQLFHPHRVQNPPLRAGLNTVAVEVHQVSRTSTDLGFDLEIVAERGFVDSPEVLAMPMDTMATKLAALGMPPGAQVVYWHRRSEQLVKAQQFDVALEALSQLSTLQGMRDGDPRQLRLRALVAQREGREDEALELFSAAMDGVIRQAASGSVVQAVTLPLTLRQAAHMVRGKPGDVGFLFRLLSWGRLVSEAELGLVRRWAEASIAGDPDGLEEVWFGLTENLGQHEEALALARRVCDSLPKPSVGAPAGELRRYKRWLRLSEHSERAMGNVEVADALAAQVGEIPPRPPGMSVKSINLDAHYNGSLYDGRSWSNKVDNNLEFLPESFVASRGVEFDLRGVVQLESGLLPVGKTASQMVGQALPVAVREIPVHQEAPAIHFLTSVQWGREESGAEVARFVIHLDDGQSESLPVRYREEVVDWFPGNGAALEHVGWRGSSSVRSDVVLSELVWKNPHPDKTIVSIDFVSTEGKAAPFLVGITLE